MNKYPRQKHEIIQKLSNYIAKSGEARLPPEVMLKAKHHILDTLAAIVSGSTLKPGKLVTKFVKKQGGAKEALVLGSRIITSATNAAFANAIMAHADETDDSHPKSRTHPGCVIVPAALSMAEKVAADGTAFLKGVVAGYDVGCRITPVFGQAYLRKRSRSTHSIGGNFGAAAAAASIARLGEDEIRYVISYACQQASGVTSLYRDEEHIEKAFVFAGMPARNGLTATVLVQAGFTGVKDPFSGEHNFLKAFSTQARPEFLINGLGNVYEILFTNIKKYSVGSPIQAPLDALLVLMEKHGFSHKDVKTIVARLPDYGAPIVNNRDMPDINLQYILAVALIDKKLTFESAHSYKRMKDPVVVDIKKRIQLVEDPELSAAKVMRQGIVEVVTKDGSKFVEHVVSVRGTSENPMSQKEIENKSLDLLIPVLGKDRSKKLIHTIWNLEKLDNIRDLRTLLSA